MSKELHMFKLLFRYFPEAEIKLVNSEIFTTDLYAEFC